jgi:hypothetical protein
MFGEFSRNDIRWRRNGQQRRGRLVLNGRRAPELAFASRPPFDKLSPRHVEQGKKPE